MHDLKVERVLSVVEVIGKRFQPVPATVAAPIWPLARHADPIATIKAIAELRGGFTEIEG